MRVQGKVRPSKPMSALAMIGGCVFICIGIFVAIPGAGIFGVFWTILALFITIYHAFNVFSDRGIAHEVVDYVSIDSSSDSSQPISDTTETRLKRLDTLRRKGLVTEKEYEIQRDRILSEL